MPGIYGMAILTIAVTALLCAAALNQWVRSDRRFYWLLLTGLPLSLIVNRFVKAPLIASLAAWTGIPLKLGLDAPFWFIALIWLNAPVFEEAIKVLPMVLPVSRVFLRDDLQALGAGLALGMGFGLGEAAYLAYGIAQSPVYTQLPWYSFTAFASERLIVTFGHALLTALAVLGLYRGRGQAVFGYLTAVGLHAIINLGPILSALKVASATIAGIATNAVILGAFFIFQKKLRSARRNHGSPSQEIVYFER